MTRLWVLTAILFALAIAGCGPDCDKYCNKVVECRQRTPAGPQIDLAQCVLGCNDSGGDHKATIDCYIDHTCEDIAAGHCSATGQPPQ